MMDRRSFALFIAVAICLSVSVVSLDVSQIIPNVPPTCEHPTQKSCKLGDDLNPFGKDFIELGCGKNGASCSWKWKICTADSDFDGAFNGEELGDACCVFGGSIPTDNFIRDTGISHPARSDSKPAVEICSAALPVPTEAFLGDLSAGLSKARLRLGAFPEWSAACVCQARVDILFMDANGSDIGEKKSYYVNRADSQDIIFDLPSGAVAGKASAFFTNLYGVAAKGMIMTTSFEERVEALDAEVSSPTGELFKIIPRSEIVTRIPVPWIVYGALTLLLLVLGPLRKCCRPNFCSGCYRLQTRPCCLPKRVCKVYKCFEGALRTSVISYLVLLCYLGITAFDAWWVYETNKITEGSTQALGTAFANAACMPLALALFTRTRFVTPRRLLLGLNYGKSLKFSAFFNFFATALLIGFVIVNVGILNSEISSNYFVIGAAAAALLAWMTVAIRRCCYDVYQTFYFSLPAAGGLIFYELWSERFPEQLAGGVAAGAAIMCLVDMVYFVLLSHCCKRFELDPDEAPVTLSRETAFLRIRVNSSIKLKPGQCVNITSGGLSFSGHPFAIFPLPADSDSGDSWIADNVFKTRWGDRRVGVLVKRRVQGGARCCCCYPWTSRLVRMIGDAEGGDGSAEDMKLPPINISGPCGGYHNMKHYDAIIVVAGGSGIAPALAVMGGVKEEKIAGIFWSFRELPLYAAFSLYFTPFPSDLCAFHDTRTPLSQRTEVSDRVALIGPQRVDGEFAQLRTIDEGESDGGASEQDEQVVAKKALVLKGDSKHCAAADMSEGSAEGEDADVEKGEAKEAPKEESEKDDVEKAEPTDTHQAKQDGSEENDDDDDGDDGGHALHGNAIIANAHSHARERSVSNTSSLSFVDSVFGKLRSMRIPWDKYELFRVKRPKNTPPPPYPESISEYAENESHAAVEVEPPHAVTEGAHAAGAKHVASLDEGGTTDGNASHNRPKTTSSSFSATSQKAVATAIERVNFGRGNVTSFLEARILSVIQARPPDDRIQIGVFIAGPDSLTTEAWRAAANCQTAQCSVHVHAQSYRY